MKNIMFYDSYAPLRHLKDKLQKNNFYLKLQTFVPSTKFRNSRVFKIDKFYYKLFR